MPLLQVAIGFRPIFFVISMWAVVFYAIRRGGWAERSAAGGHLWHL